MDVKEWLGEDNQIGIDIMNNKYLQNEESFEEWLHRISGGDEELKILIRAKKFLFGGRILSNRGLADQLKVTYSNCYVMTPPEDNIESIFDCAKKLARTYSYGGGCGVDIGKLSPRGAKVNNTAKETSGSVSFMDLYSMVTGLIGQNGRRGALMLYIPCNHPDLEEFIDIKTDLDRVTKANISIRITDDFMRAVKNRSEYTLSFTREETGEVIEKVVDAYEMFHKICQTNWDYAEPGMLFWDRIEKYNLLSDDDEFHYAGTNPCAEEPLPAGGSCLLGSINLSEFVKDKQFDFDDFQKSVKIAVKALNDVLDEGLPLHPLQEQRDSVRDWRQIGLGVFGMADMLIKLGIRYGSKESLSICDEIGFTMANAAIQASAELARDFGVYPKYKKSEILTSDFLINNTTTETLLLVEQYGLRNSQLLTVAPTGSLSTTLGVSGGLEPVFANYYTRKTESLHGKDVYYKVYTPIVADYIKETKINDDTLLPGYFITAHDLDYYERIRMQSVWQKHIDASISSTINLPYETEIKDVENLYMYAWEKGLKGVTIFRDGCKRIGILNVDSIDDEDSQFTSEQNLPWGSVLSPSDDLVGLKRSITSGCGSLHVTAFFDPTTGELQETYFSKGSTGGCANFMVGLSRMISLAARAGVALEVIVDQMLSTGVCPSYAVRSATKRDTSKGSCCPMAIGNALLDMHKEFKNNYFDEESVNDDAPHKEESSEETYPICPTCGERLYFEGGCNICKNCGYSKCD